MSASTQQIAAAEKLLHSVFGYASFRLDQERIIANVLDKKDTLVVMPTGGGKSLCYQIPALVFEGLTVVVSPLISLMQDQVMQLKQLGVAAVCLNSSLDLVEYEENIAAIRAGKVKLLYLAPETLFLARTQALLKNIKVDCLTIDEAHCISDWGHDFRPEYRKLAEVRGKFAEAVTIALTATATAQVRADIKAQLAIPDSHEFVSSFDRPNLQLHVLPKANPESQVLGILRDHPNESGIVYCFSKAQVDELSTLLAARNFSVKPYHAGLSDMLRAKNQELFIRDDVQIIVATIAFGMGINKPNVRFVIHYDLPKNIESYYQEIGRAGRDSLKADCFLLYSHSDSQKIKYFISQKGDDEKRVALRQLTSLIHYAESDGCRRKSLLAYFGENAAESCGACDACLNPPKDKIDLTVPAQKFMSCVKKTGERFGAAYVVDVLRGAKTEKIFANAHDKLSTYGIGRDIAKQGWLALARQLIRQGLLAQDAEFSTLSLTAAAVPVLKSEKIFLGDSLQTSTRDHPFVKGAAGERSQIGGVRPELFELLRKRRKELADEQNVAPYMIFSDKTLVDMCARLPQSHAELLEVHGVGEMKMRRYGDEFLPFLRAHAAN
ncbi:MAG: DNA helicase RecQ [Spirochaetes bacterium]|nr:DNA helicase RecQ [Spirochaetota bacterium]